MGTPRLERGLETRDHYDFYGGDLFAGQGTLAYDDTLALEHTGHGLTRLDGWNNRIAEYPTLFPNLFLGFQSDHLWTRIIEPISPSCTRDHFQLYYRTEDARSDQLAETRRWRLETWAKVIYEDISVVEGMQRGRHSPAFAGGVFSPAMDQPSHFFAKWFANTMTAES